MTPRTLTRGLLLPSVACLLLVAGPPAAAGELSYDMTPGETRSYRATSVSYPGSGKTPIELTVAYQASAPEPGTLQFLASGEGYYHQQRRTFQDLSIRFPVSRHGPPLRVGKRGYEQQPGAPGLVIRPDPGAGSLERSVGHGLRALFPSFVQTSLQPGDSWAYGSTALGADNGEPGEFLEYPVQIEWRYRGVVSAGGQRWHHLGFSVTGEKIARVWVVSKIRVSLDATGEMFLDAETGWPGYFRETGALVTAAVGGIAQGSAQDKIDEMGAGRRQFEYEFADLRYLVAFRTRDESPATQAPPGDLAAELAGFGSRPHR